MAWKSKNNDDLERAQKVPLENVKEVAAIQARMAAIEVLQNEIKPELKELSKPHWGIIIPLSAAFITFMAFYTGLIRSVQSSDSYANTIAIRHAVGHIETLETDHKTMRADFRELLLRFRAEMFTVKEHELFDKDRFEKLRLMENRLLWLEQNYSSKNGKR